MTASEISNLVIAIASLIGAISAIIHSVQTRRMIQKSSSANPPSNVKVKS